MANAKQVLDVQVSKGITAAQGNEHLRNRSKEAEKYAMSKGNYDPTRKHLNFEIASGGKIRPIDTSRNIPERMADILGRRGIKEVISFLKSRYSGDKMGVFFSVIGYSL